MLILFRFDVAPLEVALFTFIFCAYSLLFMVYNYLLVKVGQDTGNYCTYVSPLTGDPHVENKGSSVKPELVLVSISKPIQKKGITAESKNHIFASHVDLSRNSLVLCS